LAAIDGCPFEVLEEDLLRAQIYALLGQLLVRPPDQALLDLAGNLEGDDDTPLGSALNDLAKAARATSVEDAETEYNALFIGITRGELIPYASYYLTGFLHERPLADLRTAMSKLGIARAEGVVDPEDHIASLCEMMRGMMTGVFGKPVPLDEQCAFFDAHIATWAPKFFEDLERAEGASLYAPVGRIGRHFMAIETEAFELAA
jgi:TorA maturation chaperone TorD